MEATLTRIQRELVIPLHLKPFLGHYKLQKLDSLYFYKREFLKALGANIKRIAYVYGIIHSKGDYWNKR